MSKKNMFMLTNDKELSLYIRNVMFPFALVRNYWMQLFVCLFVLFVLFAHVFICIAMIGTSLSIRNMLFPFALVGNH